jgi:hypothetical protein
MYYIRFISYFCNRFIRKTDDLFVVFKIKNRKLNEKIIVPAVQNSGIIYQEYAGRKIVGLCIGGGGSKSEESFG